MKSIKHIRQIVLTRQIGTVLDVRDDHQRAHRRQQRLVAILLPSLVLDEVSRLEHLADVVKVRPDANQQSVGTDRFGGGLGDGRDVDRMVVRPGSTSHQFLQQRMSDVAEFQQAEVRLHVEESFDEGQ